MLNLVNKYTLKPALHRFIQSLCCLLKGIPSDSNIIRTGNRFTQTVHKFDNRIKTHEVTLRLAYISQHTVLQLFRIHRYVLQFGISRKQLVCVKVIAQRQLIAFAHRLLVEVKLAAELLHKL
ncbi:hypothetical protein EVA_06132 [gut metagenome]|uniref:Uncharacterized protein n=1 Tax=gut metagenome TaxID=749906 RepID=J9GEH2_9ZZZZ